MLTLRLVTTVYGQLQADAARSLLDAVATGRGMLVVSRDCCRPDIHRFGWSVDIDVKSTMTSFSGSGVSELVIAARDRQAFGRWMRQFGFLESKRRGHFDVLSGYQTVGERIESCYGQHLTLSNVDVQAALSRLTGRELPRDGVLDERCDYAARLADDILGTRDRGAFSVAFRRTLAIAAAEIIEVTSD